MPVKDSLWQQLKAETAEDFSFLAAEEFHESPSECYFVTGDAFGGGEHGGALLADFFTTMVNERYYPKSIILMDRAVLFLTKGHALCGIFTELEENGTAVFVSAKSAALYGVTDEIDPILITETGCILRILRDADKVITL